MKNLTTSFARAAMLLLLAVFTTTPALATDYIKDLMLIGAPSESEINTLKTTYQNQGWTVIDQDLNENVDKSGRDYIYLLCKKESSNNINFGYITNLFLKEGNNPVDEFTESGHTYKLVPYAGGTQFVNNKGDLNSGAGSNSKYIYLYYSKDDSGTNDYCLIDIYFQTSQSSAAGALGLNGSWETGYDLNKGGGGAYIYLHANSNMAPAYTVTLYSGTPGNTSEYNFTYKTNNPNHVASSGSAAANCQFYRSGNDIYFKLEPSYDDILTPVSGYYFNGWGWGNGTHHKLTSVATSKTAQWIQGADLSKLSGHYTAQNGDLLTGTLAGNYKISIADGATVTLSGVTINGNDNNSNYKWAGINCLGNVTIILAEGTTNNVKGFSSQSGIYVKTGYTLTIKGQGTLNATGGSLGAGIGGANTSPAGNIVIESGIIEAVGGYGSAGIGAGYELGASSGNITISGGTIKATGGNQAAGIGAGHGSASDSFCGNIIINGGTVYAYGGSSAAGIGAGWKIGCGDITITNGVTSVTATKGSNAPFSIGKGKYSNCGTITIGDLVTGDISLSPFETYPYTVTFNANGGTGTMTSLNLMNNVPQQLSNNTFAYTNLVFGEWNTQANGSGTSYANQQSVSSLTSTSGATVTLYAQWQSNSLTDGTAYRTTQDGSVTTATYRRTIEESRVGKHQSWLVPFDYAITADDLQKFNFYKINMIANSPNPSQDATDQMWLFLTKLETVGTVLHANMPYVIKAKEAVTNYAFTSSNVTLKAKNTGVILKTETAEDVYSFYATYEDTPASGSDQFYYVSSLGNICLGTSVTIGPYRWIIRKTNKFGGTTSYAREMHFFDGEEDDATGLNEELRMKNEESSEDWYTLDGVKLSGKPTQKGIYIHGGRKEAIR